MVNFATEGSGNGAGGSGLLRLESRGNGRGNGLERSLLRRMLLRLMTELR